MRCAIICHSRSLFSLDLCKAQARQQHKSSCCKGPLPGAAAHGRVGGRKLRHGSGSAPTCSARSPGPAQAGFQAAATRAAAATAVAPACMSPHTSGQLSEAPLVRLLLCLLDPGLLHCILGMLPCCMWLSDLQGQSPALVAKIPMIKLRRQRAKRAANQRCVTRTVGATAACLGAYLCLHLLLLLAYRSHLLGTVQRCCNRQHSSHWLWLFVFSTGNACSTADTGSTSMYQYRKMERQPSWLRTLLLREMYAQ